MRFMKYIFLIQRYIHRLHQKPEMIKLLPISPGEEEIEGSCIQDAQHRDYIFEPNPAGYFSYIITAVS